MRKSLDHTNLTSLFSYTSIFRLPAPAPLKSLQSSSLTSSCLLSCRKQKGAKQRQVIPKVKRINTRAVVFKSHFISSSASMKHFFFCLTELAGFPLAKVYCEHDAARPHHQVPAAPAQEEEASQHQCSVSGCLIIKFCSSLTCMSSRWILI